MRQENVSWTDMELLKKHFTRRPLNKTGMMSGKKRHNTNNSKVRASQLTEYNLDCGYSFHNYVIRC